MANREYAEVVTRDAEHLVVWHGKTADVLMLTCFSRRMAENVAAKMNGAEVTR